MSWEDVWQKIEGIQFCEAQAYGTSRGSGRHVQRAGALAENGAQPQRSMLRSAACYAAAGSLRASCSPSRYLAAVAGTLFYPRNRWVVEVVCSLGSCTKVF